MVRHIKAVLVFILVAAAALPSLSMAQSQPPTLSQKAQTLVKTLSTQQAYPARGVNVKYKTSSRQAQESTMGIKTLPAASGLEAAEAIRLMQQDPTVEIAEPNYVLHSLWLPSEFLQIQSKMMPGYQPKVYPYGVTMGGGGAPPAPCSVPSGMTSSAQRVDADIAHTSGYRGQNQTIAIVDTGVYAHCVFSHRLLVGTNTISGSSDTNDVYGHGTHVAGIAYTICPDCSILPIKVLDDDGYGTVSEVIRGIRMSADYGARAANLSIGGYTPSAFICDAVTYAFERGTVIVTAAGNSTSSDLSSPASCANTMPVAALDFYDQPASYSNYGPKVQVSAPGSFVYSTVPPDYASSTFAVASGTSMAAPVVTGALAVIASKHPTYSQSQLSTLLLETTDNIGQPNYGKGRINVASAVVGPNAGRPVPLKVIPPSIISANGGTARVTIHSSRTLNVNLAVSTYQMTSPFSTYISSNTVTMVKNGDVFVADVTIAPNPNTTRRQIYFDALASNTAGSNYAMYEVMSVQAVDEPNQVQPTATPTNTPIPTSTPVATSTSVVTPIPATSTPIPTSTPTTVQYPGTASCVTAHTTVNLAYEPSQRRWWMNRDMMTTITSQPSRCTLQLPYQMEITFSSTGSGTILADGVQIANGHNIRKSVTKLEISYLGQSGDGFDAWLPPAATTPTATPTATAVHYAIPTLPAGWSRGYIPVGDRNSRK